jgi:curved DNA-binding protein CbpA
MVDDPYKVLGLSDDSDDEAIRRRYLQLVRQYPPEHHPEKFAAIRAAYESLRDLTTRVRHRLFAGEESDSLDAIIEELACQNTRRRLSLQTLLSLVRRA